MSKYTTGEIARLCGDWSCRFVLLGIMNPAIAKMTPWVLENLAGSLSESGLAVTAVPVDAMTSWTQFFKNMPIGLLVFVLLESSIFTKEYQSGVWVIMLSVLMSAAVNTNIAVLAGTGIVFSGAYVMFLLPETKVYSPLMLVDSAALLHGTEEAASYSISIAMTAFLCFVSAAVSIPVLNGKQL